MRIFIFAFLSYVALSYASGRKFERAGKPGMSTRDNAGMDPQYKRLMQRTNEVLTQALQALQSSSESDPDCPPGSTAEECDPLYWKKHYADHIFAIPYPEPINWDTKELEAHQHLQKLDTVFAENPELKKFHDKALEEVSFLEGPGIEPRSKYWAPYFYSRKNIKHFFRDWLYYQPSPDNPGLFIEYWDHFANTAGGLQLEADPAFHEWFRVFMNFRGDFINSSASTGTLIDWMEYKGTVEHPFDHQHYEKPNISLPTGGYASFNQFFLRNLKPDQRPLCENGARGDVVVAPADGGVFYLSKEAEDIDYNLPGKSDDFNLIDAIPGYGEKFIGGPLLDILLWFTDFHHFHAPVSGKVISFHHYPGSYNYNFDAYDVETGTFPDLPPGSDRVTWYNDLDKHQRLVWVIQTESLGLVAMTAVGFWGVGSFTNSVVEGSIVKKGSYMGHFDYGGSSIVLAFEPGSNLEFYVGTEPVTDPDHPLLMKVKECLGSAKGSPKMIN